jgi:hypothetical protein
LIKVFHSNWVVDGYTKKMSHSIENEIAALTQKVQSDPEFLNVESRAKAVKAARDLLNALTLPPETVIQDVVLNPPLLMALRVGVDLNIFQTICEGKGEGVTTQSIAEKSGASFVVVGMFPRVDRAGPGEAVTSALCSRTRLLASSCGGCILITMSE